MAHWKWEDGIYTIGKNSPHYEILAPLAFYDFNRSERHSYFDENITESQFHHWLSQWIFQHMNAGNIKISGFFVEVVGTMIHYPDVEITPFIFPKKELMADLASNDFCFTNALEEYNRGNSHHPIYCFGDKNPQSLVEMVLTAGLNVNSVQFPSTELMFLSNNGIKPTTACDILMKIADNAFENEENVEKLGEFLKNVPHWFAQLLQLGATPSDSAFDALNFYNIQTNTKPFLDHQIDLFHKRHKKSE